MRVTFTERVPSGDKFDAFMEAIEWKLVGYDAVHWEQSPFDHPYRDGVGMGAEADHCRIVPGKSHNCCMTTSLPCLMDTPTGAIQYWAIRFAAMGSESTHVDNNT